MKRYEIRVDDVPNFLGVFAYIRFKTDIVKKFKKLNEGRNDILNTFPLNYPLKNLKAAARAAVKNYGLYTWLSKEGRYTGSYRSLSMVYNPNLRDKNTNNMNGTLGSSSISRKRFFYGNLISYLSMGMHMKDSYYDSYGFCHKNDLSKNEFGDFTNTFKRTQIRSRMSMITPNALDSLNPNYMLHKDEPIYENLRINIPIDSDGNYFLESEKFKINMKEGEAYVWDTHIPHRVYGVSANPRVTLVLGFSPWFDYIPEERMWVSNEYYGEVHPLDMVKLGYVTSTVGG